jgi:hypothetical protein
MGISRVYLPDVLKGTQEQAASFEEAASRLCTCFIFFLVVAVVGLFRQRHK